MQGWVLDRKLPRCSSGFGTGLRFWHKTCLSGSTSLCELWNVTGFIYLFICSWVYLLPEDAVADMEMWARFCTSPCSTPGQPWRAGKQRPIPSPSSLLSDTGRKQRHKERLLFPLPCCWAVQRHQDRAGTLSGKAPQDKGSTERMRDMSHRHGVQRPMSQMFFAITNI